MRSRTLDDCVISNRSNFDDDHASNYLALRKSIDAQHEFTKLFFGFVGMQHFTNHRNAEKPILSALLKNEILLYAALSLTRDGLHGVAMGQLRLVYEALMIAKVCSALRDHPLIDRWIAGDTIYFSKGVLGRVVSPKLVELEELWSLLCEHSHATVFSVQVETRYEKIAPEITGALAVIGMLLVCNFHLLNRHFVTSAMARLGKRYFEDGEFLAKRHAAKASADSINSFMSPVALRVIREYRSTWEVSPD